MLHCRRRSAGGGKRDRRDGDKKKGRLASFAESGDKFVEKHSSKHPEARQGFIGCSLPIF
jgi:hypothetical protein